jgi:PKD repeat protein
MLLILVLCLVSTLLVAQGFNQKYNIYLIGQLTNDANGAPLKNYKVAIESDTNNQQSFYYYRLVYTDNEGYFYDTITTNQQKGTLHVYTYDYLDQRHDTTVHYRFQWSDNNFLFANFILPAPPIINVIQANFSYQKNPSGQNSMEYQFTDLTESNSIVGWHWEFGDGKYSNVQHPIHTYEEPGLYKVIQLVSIQVAAGQEPVTSEMVKYIYVSPKSYYHMGGHVFAGYFPIDKSEVFLYKVEDEELIPIDTAMFSDSLGYYLFYQLIEGEYIVKADLHPTSDLFNMFMTTYYADKMHWEEADTIHHHSNHFEYDINLVPNTQSSYGPGKISGDIQFDPSYGGGKSGPAENITILLYDASNVPVTIAHSNEEGLFELDDLDLQMYYVYAEVTGKYTIPVEVMLEQSNAMNPSVQIVIDQTTVNGLVSPGIGENSLDRGLSAVYPNPASDHVHITFEQPTAQELTVHILNHSGQILSSASLRFQTGSNQAGVSVADLAPGMYILKVERRDGLVAIRKFLKM